MISSVKVYDVVRWKGKIVQVSAVGAIRVHFSRAVSDGDAVYDGRKIESFLAEAEQVWVKP